MRRVSGNSNNGIGAADGEGQSEVMLTTEDEAMIDEHGLEMENTPGESRE